MPPTLPHASVGKRDEGPRRLDASRTVLAPGGSPGLAAMQPRSLTLLVFLEYIVTRHGEADPGRLAPFSCDGHACNPPVANLATGRTPVTLTTCGQNATELYCSYLHEPAPLPTLPGCGQPRCTKCNAQQPDNAHPPPDMTDDFFVHPGTWWQSAQGVHREEIQLDLETEFYLTHVIVVFKSPQPAATILERSQDHGQTWRPYKYFAINCTAAFGLQDDLTDEGSTCTSRYSDAVPCTRGEVHGKCLCSHNTAGQHCERCAPLYNDQPWKPGDGKTGEPNECKTCSCQSLGLANGMLHRTWRCHPKTGYCFCKPGVAGPNCDRCLMGYWGFGKSGCYPCNCSRDCDPHTGECVTGYEKEPIFHVPIGGQISDLIQMPENERKEQWKWNGHEQGFSALRHPEKCVCKEKVLGSVNDFCQMKFAYVIKARIVSAHDKGTHAEVVVKVKKILKSGKVKISRNNRSIYPESWMNRGCTCPILNPGTDYLVAGQEDTRSGKLLVNMNSLVKPWKAFLGKQVAHILRTGCK
uniref:Netrin-4 n=1 Tax=Ornithorhynchus anatinus TaxID=9258 RepID=A0A6I8NP73_ORNAN